MNSSSLVTAIIPTLAEEGRSASLIRAIESLRRATLRSLQIVVVVNGERYSDTVIESLRRMKDVKIIRVETASLPNALYEARKVVQSPYFCFLDDDDEYLPGAIDRRLTVVIDERLDVVVSNGYRHSNGTDILNLERLDEVRGDPLKALLNENWLASCGGLFATESVSSELFEEIHPYMEWTWLAFRFSLARMRIGVLQEPTYRIFDSPNSASKSLAFCKSPIALFERMLANVPKGEIAASIRTKQVKAWHTLAGYYANSGEYVLAIKCHVRSLSRLSGWRYLSATGPLLCRIVRALIRGPSDMSR